MNGVTVRHAEVLPPSIDCSGAMSWVSFKLFNDDGRLTAGKTNTVTASLMFKHLIPVDVPLPGDFAFYTRPRDAKVGHVMMVTDAGGVIGACEIARKVAEFPGGEFDTRWVFCGCRMFPL
jgi:hypothetical protein